VVTRPEDYLTLLGFLEFSECSCEHYNRFETEKRDKLERKLIDSLAKNSPDKERQIRLLSLGSGELLQDWILIGKLLREGFKDISIYFIEPDQKLTDSKLQKFQEFYNQLPDCRVSVLGRGYSLSYPEKKDWHFSRSH